MKKIDPNQRTFADLSSDPDVSKQIRQEFGLDDPEPVSSRISVAQIRAHVHQLLLAHAFNIVVHYKGRLWVTGAEVYYFFKHHGIDLGTDREPVEQVKLIALVMGGYECGLRFMIERRVRVFCLESLCALEDLEKMEIRSSSGTPS